MQLQDVLDAPQLRIRAVFTTPEALARPVNWTFTTDLLDPRRYLARDQLVLTGMMWRRTPEDSETFVSAVAASGAVALLAGEGLYGFVPDDVLEACRAHGVALFAVPADVSFASITAHLSNALAGDRVARLTAGLARQRQLLTPADQPRSGQRRFWRRRRPAAPSLRCSPSSHWRRQPLNSGPVSDGLVPCAARLVAVQ